MLRKIVQGNVCTLRTVSALACALLALAVPAAFTGAAQPVAAAGPTIVQFSAGAGHSIVLKSDGTVWTWGDNTYGQLGVGTADKLAHFTPTQVPNLIGVKAISNGSHFTAALKTDGTVWTWGRNNTGQLGLGTSDTLAHPRPAKVKNLTGVAAITGGHQHSLVRKTDGTLWAWGWNQYGQLGDGSRTTRKSPVRVGSLTNVTILPQGSGFANGGAVTGDGRLWLWGKNGYGQIDGTGQDKLTPTDSGMSGIRRFGIGREFVIVQKTDGTVWSWGYNGEGNLGLGTSDQNSHTTPQQISSLAGALSIRVGSRTSAALKSNGTVASWGENTNGEIGDGTTTNRSSPTQAKNLTNVDSIAEGSQHSLAQKSDGTLWAWGDNSRGGLGHPASISSTTPAQVQGI
jgi:alpha-tubulin suppressor-like RCC1 family protein